MAVKIHLHSSSGVQEVVSGMITTFVGIIGGPLTYNVLCNPPLHALCMPGCQVVGVIRVEG